MACCGDIPTLETLAGYTFADGTVESVFVPFLDGTSGSETYGAGRYLDLEPDEMIVPWGSTGTVRRGGGLQSAKQPQKPPGRVWFPATGSARHSPVTAVPSGQVNGQVPEQLALALHGPGVGVAGGGPQLAMQAHPRVGASVSPTTVGAATHSPLTVVPSGQVIAQLPPHCGPFSHGPGVGGGEQSPIH